MSIILYNNYNKKKGISPKISGSTMDPQQISYGQLYVLFSS